MEDSWIRAKVIAEAARDGRISVDSGSIREEAQRSGYGISADAVVRFAQNVLKKPGMYDPGVVQQAWAFRPMQAN